MRSRLALIVATLAIAVGLVVAPQPKPAAAANCIIPAMNKVQGSWSGYVGGYYRSVCFGITLINDGGGNYHFTVDAQDLVDDPGVDMASGVCWKWYEWYHGWNNYWPDANGRSACTYDSYHWVDLDDITPYWWPWVAGNEYTTGPPSVFTFELTIYNGHNATTKRLTYQVNW